MSQSGGVRLAGEGLKWKNLWQLNKKEEFFEMGGFMTVAIRQCHVHPAYVQLLNFHFHKKVKLGSRVMGYASVQRGTGQGEKLPFMTVKPCPWPSESHLESACRCSGQ